MCVLNRSRDILCLFTSCRERCIESTMIRGDLAFARKGPTKPLSFLKRGPSDAYLGGSLALGCVSLAGRGRGRQWVLMTHWLKLHPGQL